MFGLGFSEILFLAILGLVVIGPKQLPEVARTIGRFLNELRRSTSVFTDELKSQVKVDPFDLKSTLNKNISTAPRDPVSPTTEQMELPLQPLTEVTTVTSQAPTTQAQENPAPSAPSFVLHDRDNGQKKES